MEDINLPISVEIPVKMFILQLKKAVTKKIESNYRKIDVLLFNSRPYKKINIIGVITYLAHKTERTYVRLTDFTDEILVLDNKHKMKVRVGETVEIIGILSVSAEGNRALNLLSYFPCSLKRLNDFSEALVEEQKKLKEINFGSISNSLYKMQLNIDIEEQLKPIPKNILYEFASKIIIFVMTNEIGRLEENYRTFTLRSLSTNTQFKDLTLEFLDEMKLISPKYKLVQDSFLQLRNFNLCEISNYRNESDFSVTLQVKYPQIEAFLRENSQKTITQKLNLIRSKFSRLFSTHFIEELEKYAQIN